MIKKNQAAIVSQKWYFLNLLKCFMFTALWNVQNINDNQQLCKNSDQPCVLFCDILIPCVFSYSVCR